MSDSSPSILFPYIVFTSPSFTTLDFPRLPWFSKDVASVDALYTISSSKELSSVTNESTGSSRYL
jgi:hypothetical protein